MNLHLVYNRRKQMSSVNASISEDRCDSYKLEQLWGFTSGNKYGWRRQLRQLWWLRRLRRLWRLKEKHLLKEEEGLRINKTHPLAIIRRDTFKGTVTTVQRPSIPIYRVSTSSIFQNEKFRSGRKKISMDLTITRPDDWHVHLRDGDILEAVVPHSARVFGRAIVMPNLKPPVTTTASALAYRESIMKVLPSDSDFIGLKFWTDNTTPEEIKLAKKSGLIYAVKLYPSGATTNSQDGVTDIFGKCFPVLEEMIEQNMPLLVHGEVTDPNLDIFDREKVFIDSVLGPLVRKLPDLKIVMEHITTADAVRFVLSCGGNVGATVTPQHLLNRNSIFQGGLRPHHYCLPVLKREEHRAAIVSAVTGGGKQFFLGTDSAPHERGSKESSCGCAGMFNAPVALSVYAKVFEEAGALDKLEAFASFNGPDFYGLPRNSSTVTLRRSPWKVPESYGFASGEIVPMSAGLVLDWYPSLS